MTPHKPSDWKDLAEQVSKEMDPKRLMDLVVELNRILGEQEAASPPTTTQMRAASGL